jgi:hypothetical protein
VLYCSSSIVGKALFLLDVKRQMQLEGYIDYSFSSFSSSFRTERNDSYMSSLSRHRCILMYVRKYSSVPF